MIMRWPGHIISPVLFGLLLFLATLSHAIALSAESRALGTDTYFASIRYQDTELFYEFGRRIGGSTVELARDGARTRELVTEKVDKIVHRVRSILDMHPPGFRFNINLYGSKGALTEAYRGLGMTGEVPVAFYSHRTRTVYLTVEALTEGIFAHEVSHAVINSYYDPPLPARMQEILSQYVDRHLWED